MREKEAVPEVLEGPGEEPERMPLQPELRTREGSAERCCRREERLWARGQPGEDRRGEGKGWVEG